MLRLLEEHDFFLQKAEQGFCALSKVLDLDLVIDAHPKEHPDVLRACALGLCCNLHYLLLIRMAAFFVNEVSYHRHCALALIRLVS